MAQTWMLNKDMPFSSSVILPATQVNFISNGVSYSTIQASLDTGAPSIQIIYSKRGIGVVPYQKTTSGGSAWTDEGYRTITFQTNPTGDLLTWLQKNATQQLLCDANDMTAVADAIRTKAGSTAVLSFPNGFVSAVNGIQTGGLEQSTVTIQSSDYTGGNVTLAYVNTDGSTVSYSQSVSITLPYSFTTIKNSLIRITLVSGWGGIPTLSFDGGTFKPELGGSYYVVPISSSCVITLTNED